MPGDASLILLNRTTIDSASDGLGSGTDPTSGAGAVLSVAEECELAATLFLSISDTSGEPGDADTLDVIVEASADGGSSYDPVFTFRTVTGIEVPNEVSDGTPTVRLAGLFRTPRADAGQSNTILLRLNVTCSDGSNWGIYSDVRGENDVRAEWMAAAGVA